MSYCRWIESDVYAYQSENGDYIIFVSLDEIYNESSLECFKSRMLSLQRAGKYIPKYVFDRIEEELKEE